METLNRLFSTELDRHIPEIEVADYRPPTAFPQLSRHKRVTIDLETQGLDPLRGSYVVGYGVQADGKSEYYPVRHKTGMNCDADQVESWLATELKHFKGDIVGANSNLFDALFMRKANIRPQVAKWRDVQWAEALLDEYAESYGLEALGQKYLGRGKSTTSLEAAYGEEAKKWFAEIHPAHARTYNLVDLEVTEAIYKKQLPFLRGQKLQKLFDLECRLTPLLLDMREQGVRIDLEAAEKLEIELAKMYRDGLAQLARMVGFDVDPFSGPSLAAAFDHAHITYPLTDKGNPSFRKDWLKAQKHPLATLINEVRGLEKIRGTFVRGYILDGNINGRIHAQFHPLRRVDDDDDEDGAEQGTVSGRFSSSNPNLQNIPARSDLGRRVRELFIPDEGMLWYSADYSQMEYRLLVHYAYVAHCTGADIARDAYLRDPKTDFHQFCTELVFPNEWAEAKASGDKQRMKDVRTPAKSINFGLAYGMGVKKLAASLGLVDANGDPLPEALEKLNTYHERAPFVREVSNLAMKTAQERGFVKTILGRHARFELWEPKFTEKGAYYEPLPHDAALAAYGPKLKRSRTHKALNCIMQGSNADATKLAMVTAYEEGLFKDGRIKLAITVHDELDGPVIPGEEGEGLFGRLKEIMRDAVKLEVPVMVEGDLGKNWAEAH